MVNGLEMVAERASVVAGSAEQLCGAGGVEEVPGLGRMKGTGGSELTQWDRFGKRFDVVEVQGGRQERVVEVVVELLSGDADAH